MIFRKAFYAGALPLRPSKHVCTSIHVADRLGHPFHSMLVKRDCYEVYHFFCAKGVYRWDIITLTSHKNTFVSLPTHSHHFLYLQIDLAFVHWTYCYYSWEKSHKCNIDIQILTFCNFYWLSFSVIIRLVCAILYTNWKMPLRISLSIADRGHDECNFYRFYGRMWSGASDSHVWSHCEHIILTSHIPPAIAHRYRLATEAYGE